LPREVRGCGFFDRRAEIGVFDTLDSGLQRRIERGRRWDLAERAALRRAIDRIERGDAEPDRFERVAARAEAIEELRRKHLELVRPNARRHAHDERAALDRNGMRAIRDARTDRGSPLGDRDRRPPFREAIFAGAIEHFVERLGRRELRASSFPSRARHRAPMLASGRAWTRRHPRPGRRRLRAHAGPRCARGP
jgi:hypothetical protein